MSRWTVRFATPEDYYRLVPAQHINSNWVREPVVSWQQNGPVIINDYPWVVHENVRHRFNPKETCRFDMVTRDGMYAVVSWDEGPCDTTYNQCADHRNRTNWQNNSNRNFCAERVGARFRNDGRVPYSSLPTAPDRDLTGGVDVWAAPERRVERRDDDRREEPNRGNDRDSVRFGPWNNYGRNGYVYGGARVFRTYPEVFYAARAGQLPGCEVKRARFNLGGCHWKAEVMNRHYPFNENEVCSSPRRAARVGCNISNSQEENVGCLLAMAINQGYCR
jgi:hypothetical protein